MAFKAMDSAATLADWRNAAPFVQDRMAQLELNLEEERQSGDQLMDRIDRGREQVEQFSQSARAHYRLTCVRLLLHNIHPGSHRRVSVPSGNDTQTSCCFVLHP